MGLGDDSRLQGAEQVTPPLTAALPDTITLIEPVQSPPGTW